MPLTQSLGQFVADLSHNRIPSEAVRIAKTGFTDCVAVMIAGRNEHAPQTLRNVLNPDGSTATLYFSDARAAAPEAAWINGTAAHALDYDDVARDGHISAVLVPAILAEAESLDCSGTDMIVAYVAGYETWTELSQRERGLHYGKGWHSTGIFGSIGAAAACASLRKLAAGQAANALAIGASQSGGLISNFGTMTKPFHAGRAAHSGLIAARLAAAGFSASKDALEHPQGFLGAVSPAGDVDRDSEPAELGSRWKTVTHAFGVKRYPVCYCCHRAIDGILAIMREHRPPIGEIEQIEVTISDNYAAVLRNHMPVTALEAKFSMEFAMSSAILTGRVGLGELTDTFVDRADVRALMQRVKVSTTTEYDDEMPGAAAVDHVRVCLADGRTLESGPIRRARGHASLPLSQADLFEKFSDCVQFGGFARNPEPLFDCLMNLERSSARELTASDRR